MVCLNNNMYRLSIIEGISGLTRLSITCIKKRQKNKGMLLNNINIYDLLLV